MRPIAAILLLGLVGCGARTPSTRPVETKPSAAPPIAEHERGAHETRPPEPTAEAVADTLEYEEPHSVGAIAATRSNLPIGTPADPGLIVRLPYEIEYAQGWRVCMVGDDPMFLDWLEGFLDPEDGSITYIREPPTLPARGRYAAIAFGGHGRRFNVAGAAVLTAGAGPFPDQHWTPDLEPKTDDKGRRMSLTLPQIIRSGVAVPIEVRMTDKKGTTLEPGIGLESFRILVVSENFGAADFAAQAKKMKDEMRFRHQFDRAGTYRLYVMYRDSIGRSIGPPKHLVFTVRVEEGGSK